MFSRRESGEVKGSDAVISFNMKKLSHWLIWNFLVTREKTCISRGLQMQVVVCCLYLLEVVAAVLSEATEKVPKPEEF